MARDTITLNFMDELELQSAQIAELSERGVNKWKKIDEVSPHQGHWKVAHAHVTTLSNQALWFAHSFGLKPEFVQFRKVATGSSLLAVHLSDDPRSYTHTPTAYRRL